MNHQADDKIIIEQILNGDKQAYTLLVKRYQQKVFRLCMGFMHNPDDAADLTQEVFIKAYQKLSTYKGDSKFSTWLYRVSVNMAINSQRKQKIRATFNFYDNGNETQQIADTRYADENINELEQKQMVKKILDSLPASQRKAIVLSHYEELSNKELAEVMGLSVKASESLLYRARSNMQKMIKKQK